MDNESCRRSRSSKLEGTFRVKRSKSRRGVRRVRVSADGVGVVSHAGVGLLREVANLTGLIENVTEVLADTYKGRGCTTPAGSSPIWRWRSRTVLIACPVSVPWLISRSCTGPVASLTTTWRLLD